MKQKKTSDKRRLISHVKVNISELTETAELHLLCLWSFVKSEIITQVM